MRRVSLFVLLTISSLLALFPEHAVARPPAEAGARIKGHRISPNPTGTHMCRIKEDGFVACWGNNQFGQLGDGVDPRDRNSEFTVPGLNNVISVAAGLGHSCALRANGQIFCWGDDSAGQLGSAALCPCPTPVPVIATTGLIRAVALTAGGNHTCALRNDGKVFCWGENGDGQLGDGGAADQATPTEVGGQLDGVVSIAAGGFHTCALRFDGTVRCWGRNSDGQVGDLSPAIGRTTPAAVRRLDPNRPTSSPPLTGIVSIAAGRAHTCGVASDGTLLCWGDTSNGQVVPAPASGRQLAAVRNPNVANAVAVAAGGNHTCVLRGDGTARCWGRNIEGQLGNGTRTSDTLPQSPGTLPNLAAVAAGGAHTCTLAFNDQKFCWGSNSDGQIGIGVLGSILDRPTGPVIQNQGVTAFGITAGGRHTCARRSNGALACWGDNRHGQLGNGTTADRLLPTPVTAGPTTAPFFDVASITAGFRHSCAIVGNGTGRCWGDEYFDVLTPQAQPDGSIVNVPVPQFDTHPVMFPALSGGDLVAITKVDRFSRRACALRSDGTVFCLRSVGSDEAGLSDVISVTGGSTDDARFVCTLDVDGSASCSGDNSHHQLGNALVGQQAMIAIASGDLHTCGLLVGGGVACWGDNGHGQLGPTLVQVSPDAPIFQPALDAVAIAAGRAHTCALLSSGIVKCWGDNSSGQLGNGGAPIDSSTPVTVRVVTILGSVGPRPIAITTDLSDIVAIAAGGAHSCAVRADGQVFCWGVGGTIGNGGTSGSNIAQSVPSFGFNIDPHVVLKHHRHGRAAEVTVLASCPAGEKVHIEVTLTQGATSGHGQTVAHCKEGLHGYPVTVHAHRDRRFQEGPAEAQADAVIRDRGVVIDRRQWTRQVEFAF